MPDIHIDQTSGGVGALVDDNGLYWVAVGPKVPSPDHQDGAPTAREMYGRGTLDAVLKDLEYNCYYLHCKIGGTKEHTYNNGVFQTWYRYSDHAFETYATADYDGTVCIEFFVDPNHDGTMNYSDKGATLGAYSIEKIIFYDNPEIITT